MQTRTICCKLLTTPIMTESLKETSHRFADACNYTEKVSKVGIWATQKLPRLNDRKRAHIVNMGTFTIVQPRSFGAAEIPIFESFSVFILNITSEYQISNANKLHKLCYYTKKVSKVGIWATQKLPRLNDRKRAHIVNMGTFTIVQPRGFGAAEIPIFESFSV